MLQRTPSDLTGPGDAPDLAAVEQDVAENLARWPQPDPVRRPDPIVRLAAGPDGRLVQRAGRRLAKAAAAPGVQGRLVYAIGDIHGAYGLLTALLARLAEDAAHAAEGRRATVVLLGDYVDRGPDSARVLEALVALRRHAPFDLCLLKGNHEQALLRFVDAPAEAAAWIAFGGAATLASYGVEPPGADEPPQAYEAARDQLLARMPAAHLRLLQTLDLMAVIGGYAFVHAGLAPGEPLIRQTEQDLLWIRKEFLEHRGRFERIVVHGHTWADDRPHIDPHRIGLDTGAYETGVLSAMRIEDQGLTPLQVRDPDRPRWRRPGEPAPWSPVAAPLDFTSTPADLAPPPIIRPG